jgi:hypothetical protein
MKSLLVVLKLDMTLHNTAVIRNPCLSVACLIRVFQQFLEIALPD